MKRIFIPGLVWMVPTAYVFGPSGRLPDDWLDIYLDLDRTIRHMNVRITVWKDDSDQFRITAQGSRRTIRTLPAFTSGREFADFTVKVAMIVK